MTNFTELETWTYEGKEPSVFTFFETIELSDLTEKWIRLSADVQRELLGFPVFGKMAFKVLKNSKVLTR